MKKTILSMTMTSMISFCSCSFAEPAKQYFLNHISGNMALTNNYIFRGISLTKEEPAVQGGLTFTFDSKIYLALWGSNVNFISISGEQATIEGDASIGYSHTVKDVTFDLHVVRYNYPGASSATYNELMGLMTYKFITFIMGYSANVFGYHGSGTYANLGLNFDIPARYVYFENVNLSSGIGNYNLNRNVGNSYQDYNILIAKTVGDKYTFSLQWVDTNHKNPPYDGSQWVVAITAKF